MNFKERDINSSSTILDALKQMDVIEKKLLIVLKNHQFLGLLSIGDVQRAIIKSTDLNTPIESIIRQNIRYADESMSIKEIKNLMLYYRMELCPVIDENRHLKEVYFWEDLFENTSIKYSTFNLPVVIMAGGYGTRLKPTTNVIPKPLIPLKGKTMLEEIFDRFHRHGCNNFYISVNYKSDLIEYYLNTLNLPFRTNCFLEEKPLGTAGSLHLLKGQITETFFVSNCDILIEDDYSNILDYHRSNKNEITLVAAMKHFPISYGTLETGVDGQLIELKEKPELILKINSGMYILEPHLIEEIPENEFFHITHLIEKIMKRKGKVGVFPISEKSWIDMGTFSEYLKFLQNEQ